MPAHLARGPAKKPLNMSVTSPTDKIRKKMKSPTSFRLNCAMESANCGYCCSGKPACCKYRTISAFEEAKISHPNRLAGTVPSNPMVHFLSKTGAVFHQPL